MRFTDVVIDAVDASALELRNSLPQCCSGHRRERIRQEFAPDDRLRDEAIHLASEAYGLLRFARNDAGGGRF